MGRDRKGAKNSLVCYSHPLPSPRLFPSYFPLIAQGKCFSDFYSFSNTTWCYIPNLFIPRRTQYVTITATFITQVIPKRNSCNELHYQSRFVMSGNKWKLKCDPLNKLAFNGKLGYFVIDAYNNVLLLMNQFVSNDWKSLLQLVDRQFNSDSYVHLEWKRKH